MTCSQFGWAGLTKANPAQGTVSVRKLVRPDQKTIGLSHKSFAVDALVHLRNTSCYRVTVVFRLLGRRSGASLFREMDGETSALMELARASGLEISPEMLSVVVELLRLEVTRLGLDACDRRSG